MIPGFDHHGTEAVTITNARWDDGGPLVVSVNQQFTALTGYSSSEVEGLNLRILQGPLTDRALITELKRKCQALEYFEGVTYNYKKDGTAFLMEWNITPVFGRSGMHLFYYSVQRLVGSGTRPLVRLVDDLLPHPAALE